MAKQINPTSMITNKVRLHFPNLFEPVEKKTDKGEPTGEKAYKCALLIPKSDTETVTMLNKCMVEAAKDFFNGKPPASWSKGLRDGDTDAATLVDPLDPSKGRKPEYVGHYWINLTSKRKPEVFGRKRDGLTGKPLPLTPDQIKAGDYVCAQLNAYGFDVTTNKGIAFGIIGVQWREEGEALFGGSFAADAFDYDPETEDAFS